MRYGHGLVVGKFYPPHAGHHALIDAAAAACERLTVIVAPSATESLPLHLRLRWLRETHGPNVHFVGVHDDHPVDYADPAVWDLHMAVFRSAAGTDRVDAVFSGEPYGAELARRFGAVPVTLSRAALPVSGTAIRADPPAHWDRIGPGVRGWLARRVIVAGAESTGTTTLARALAGHFRLRGGVWARTRWVPEFGRELTGRKLAVLRRTKPYATVDEVIWEPDDFVTVAAEQNAAEDAAARCGSPILFGDTDALATTIWAERYLGAVPAGVSPLVREPDLYLITHDDGVPFVDDGLRDGEAIRSWMTHRFVRVLEAGRVPHLVLTGGYPQRLRAAVSACDALLARGWSWFRRSARGRSPGRCLRGRSARRSTRRSEGDADRAGGRMTPRTPAGWRKSLLALAVLPLALGGCGALGLGSSGTPGTSTSASAGPVGGAGWIVTAQGSATPSPTLSHAVGGYPSALPSVSFLAGDPGCAQGWELNAVLIPLTVTPGKGSLTMTWPRQYDSYYRIAAVPQPLVSGSQPTFPWKTVPAGTGCTISATITGLTSGKPYIVWLDAPATGYERDGTHHAYSGRSGVVYPL